MIQIDVPTLAYRTLGIEYVIYGEDGKRDKVKELEAERELQQKLSGYAYSKDHDHVR